ncbi:MAG: class I SAM-dependent methyltransferase [Clostridia bacterium]|nr:class I SAM-dependent methyltransferase [Clostridia bacterium]
MKNRTGWERDRRNHFDDIVANYDKIRPEYPNKLFKAVIEYCGHGENKKAVEIGAGTGKATTPFLNAGYDVTAVEISNNMSKFLLEKFAEYKNFVVITSTFEEVLLEENSYDLIYAASAFHWVDAEIGCPKAFHLLKNGGAIALFRYNMISGDGDELYDEIQKVYEKYYYSFYQSNKRPVKKSKEDFKKPSEIYIGYRFEDLKVYGFRDVVMKFFDFKMIYNADEYIAFIDTMSDHRGLPHGNKLALYEEIKQAIMKHGNSYKVDYIFQLYMGRK